MKKQSKAKPKKGSASASAAKAPKLLSGGNPQIPKGDGDGPVKAYIDAMPGWKRAVGQRLDELIEEAVPAIQRFVRWNSPFYGLEGKGYVISYHCFTKYIKLTFFKGTELKPLPPIDSKDPDARYFHIFEDDELDEDLLKKWFKQAASVQGWIP